MAVHSASPSGPIVDRACFVPPLQTLVKPMVHVILTFILLLYYCCNKKYAWVLRPMAYLKFKIQLSISRWSHGNIDSYYDIQGELTGWSTVVGSCIPQDLSSLYLYSSS